MADFESKVISSRAVLPIQGSLAGDFGLGTQYRSAGFDSAAVGWGGLAEPRSRSTQLPDLAGIFGADGPAGAGYVDLNGRLALQAGSQDANGGGPWRTEDLFGSHAWSSTGRNTGWAADRRDVHRADIVASADEWRHCAEALSKSSMTELTNSSGESLMEVYHRLQRVALKA